MEVTGCCCLCKAVDVTIDGRLPDQWRYDGATDRWIDRYLVPTLRSVSCVACLRRSLIPRSLLPGGSMEDRCYDRDSCEVSPKIAKVSPDASCCSGAPFWFRRFRSDRRYRLFRSFRRYDQSDAYCSFLCCSLSLCLSLRRHTHCGF